MSMTILKLVDHVLYQSQLDSSYRAKARQWLNIVRLKLANSKDYPFYRTTATDVSFVAGQNEYTLPTDFLKSDSCFVVSSAGKQGEPIWILEPYKFDPYNQGNVGTPRMAKISEGTSKIVFDAVPDTSIDKKYRLNYFRKPADYDLTGSDDTSTPDFPDQNVLIQEMMLIALESQDDERYSNKYQEAEMASKKHQRNMYNSEGTGQMDLSQTHFKNRTRRW